MEYALDAKNGSMAKVYSWLGAGMGIATATSVITTTSPFMMSLVNSPLGTILLIIASLFLVFGMSWFGKNLSLTGMKVMYVAYTAITGLMLSSIFVMYTLGSITSVFVTTGVLFGVMSLYGYLTKADLTKWGYLFFFALVGLLITMVVNMFLGSSVLDTIISYAGVLIFLGLTAYDTQKLKDIVVDDKTAIQGALTLFLDFINLFLFLLKILGGKRD